MKIENFSIQIIRKRIIMSADLIFDSGKQKTLYHEINKNHAKYVANDAGVFLPIALPIAMSIKENLYIDGVISKKLLKNATKIMNKLHNLGNNFSIIQVKALSTFEDKNETNEVGCFFSGGVDSFYTFLKNKKRIKNLIFVHGYDIKPNNFKLFNEVSKNITDIASKQNVNLITVRTNAREALDEYFGWDTAHEFAIASVSLFLRKGMKEIYASCGLPSLTAKHRFFNPELDILWSTEHMKLNHYGCSADKIIKIKYLSNFQIVLEYLRVCWVNSKGKYNCSECEKCFRNMLVMYLVGSLDKCKTFAHEINLNKLKGTKIGKLDIHYFVEILNSLKIKKDQSPVRSALEACIQNNTNPKLNQKVYRSLRTITQKIDNKYNNNRLFWYLSQQGLI